MEFLDINGLVRLLDNIKGYIDTKNYIDITTINHDDLVRLKDNSNLIPGKLYRITDYIIAREDGSIKFAGHQFDIIVLALTKNTLSEEAWACKHDGDTYFENSNLSAWKIWYRLEGVGSKGVIYRMIDEFGNDCPYDFKNIMFKRYPVFKSIIENNNNSDYSLIPKYEELLGDNAGRIHNYEIINYNDEILSNDNNNFSTTLNSRYVALDNINGYISGIVEIDAGVCWCYTFSSTEIASTTIDQMLSDASLMGECLNNKIMQSDTYNNVFIGETCSNNILFEGCHDNTIGNASNFNELGPNCSYNVICSGAEYNKLDYGCNNNKIMGSYNEIRKLSLYNVLVLCDSAKIGNNCIGNLVWSNSKFGNNCDENIADGNNVTITYGNNVKRTKLSGELNNIYINDNMKDIEAEINGSPDYNIRVGKNSNGDIKYYNEVDLMS